MLFLAYLSGVYRVGEVWCFLELRMAWSRKVCRPVFALSLLKPLEKLAPVLFQDISWKWSCGPGVNFPLRSLAEKKLEFLSFGIENLGSRVGSPYLLMEGLPKPVEPANWIRLVGSEGALMSLLRLACLLQSTLDAAVLLTQLNDKF